MILFRTCLRILYFCLVDPYFLYCLPVFGATYNTHLQPLILLQKRAIRLISNAAFLANTEPLFKMQKIMKFNDLYKHSIGCYMFKNQHLLDPFIHDHTHFTRNRNLFLPPFERLRSTSQSAIHNGVSIWNEIPINVKSCLSLNSFKYQYKNYLISQYDS